MENGEGNVWVLSQRGLSLFNQHTGRLTHYTIPFEQDYNHFFDAEKEVVALHECTNGEIMWGDRRQLYFFHPARHTFWVVPLPYPCQAGRSQDTRRPGKRLLF